MRSRLLVIAARRAALLGEAARERAVLASWAGRGNGIARQLQSIRDAGAGLARHPLGVAAAAAALLVIGPRRLWRWALRGYGAWRMLRAARRWLLEATRISAAQREEKS